LTNCKIKTYYNNLSIYRNRMKAAASHPTKQAVRIQSSTGRHRFESVYETAATLSGPAAQRRRLQGIRRHGTLLPALPPGGSRAQAFASGASGRRQV
jgi:hypothetical protein